MAGVRDRIIFYPRFTTLAGTGDFPTQPINATAYAGGDITVYCGNPVVVMSGTIDLEVQVQESADGVTWANCGGSATATVPSGQQRSLSPTFERAWVRLNCYFSLTGGALPIVTTYAVGFVERRRNPAAGGASSSASNRRNGQRTRQQRAPGTR